MKTANSLKIASWLLKKSGPQVSYANDGSLTEKVGITTQQQKTANDNCSAPVNPIDHITGNTSLLDQPIGCHRDQLMFSTVYVDIFRRWIFLIS